MHEELNNFKKTKYGNWLRGIRDIMWLESNGTFAISKIKMGLL
jgi:hypothetical protein